MQKKIVIIFLLLLVAVIAKGSAAKELTKFDFSQQKEVDPLEQKAIKQLAQINEGVKSLTAEVRQFKAEITRFEEEFVKGLASGSGAQISFVDRATEAFKLLHGKFYLDGKLIKELTAEQLKKKPLKEELELFFGKLKAGYHNLRARLVYGGKASGATKIFQYYDNYRFIVDSVQPFQVIYGQVTLLNLEALDLGYGRADWDERLFVKVGSSSYYDYEND